MKRTYILIAVALMISFFVVGAMGQKRAGNDRQARNNRTVGGNESITIGGARTENVEQNKFSGTRSIVHVPRIGQEVAADSRPTTSNFRGGVFVATGDINGDGVVAGNLIGTDKSRAFNNCTGPRGHVH